MLGGVAFIGLCSTLAWAPVGEGWTHDEPPPGTMGAGLRQYEAPPDPQAAVTCDDAGVLPGIDVSKWQGGIDWNAVAGGGIEYAFIRCSHGLNTIDEYFDANWDEARAAGIASGVYQYFEPGQDPIAQADLLLDMMGPLQPGDLPPVIDVESHGNLPAAEVAAAVTAWVQHVEAELGVKPIIYTGRYFWQDYVQSNAFVDYPLWIAHYTNDCPNIPAPWTTWAFHQYTDSGSVPGVAGNVDRNDFNGDTQKLLELAFTATPPEGWLDEAGCEGLSGWAADKGSLGEVLEVELAFDPSADTPDRLVYADANLHRDDLCDALGSCAHGFELPMPARYYDGATHRVEATVLDQDGLPILLQGAPAEFSCAPPAFTDGLRRPLPAGSSTMWGFDPSLDVLPSDPGAGLDEGLDWPEQPLLVQAEGDAQVWLVDRGTRRPMSPELALAWGLDLGAAMPWPVESIDDLPQAPPLPSRPWLVQGEGGGLFVLDADLPASEGEGEPDSGGTSGGDGSDGGDDTDGGDDGGTDGESPGLPSADADRAEAGGCRVGGAAPTPALVLLGLLARLRRRRTQ